MEIIADYRSPIVMAFGQISSGLIVVIMTLIYSMYYLRKHHPRAFDVISAKAQKIFVFVLAPCTVFCVVVAIFGLRDIAQIFRDYAGQLPQSELNKVAKASLRARNWLELSLLSWLLFFFVYTVFLVVDWLPGVDAD